MSLRPSKRDDHNYVYYISDGASSPRGLPVDRRASLAFELPSRALAPKRNDMTILPSERPKVTSYPSGSAGVCRDQHPKPVSRPSGSATAYGGSVAAQSGSPKSNTRQMQAERLPRKGQSEEEEDDGSIIIVKLPRPQNTSANSRNVDLSKLSTGQLVKTVSKALSVDNLHGERDTYGQGYVQEKRCSSGTELKGLMEVMRLESLLLLLKKYLNLYHDFNESSGGILPHFSPSSRHPYTNYISNNANKTYNIIPDIFIPSTHEEFFVNINQLIVDIAEVARPLGTWSLTHNRNHNRETSSSSSSDQAFQIQKTLHAAYHIRETWIEYFDWKLDVSDPMVRVQQDEEGRVRMSTRVARVRRGKGVVAGLLGVLRDVEMDEGREGILDMQRGLRRRWRGDGKVGVEEGEGRGWVFGVGV